MLTQLWKWYQIHHCTRHTCIDIQGIYIAVQILTHWPLKGDFKRLIFKFIRQNRSLVTCCEIALKWIAQNLTDEKSTLIVIIAGCCQATNQYLNQCLCRSVSPYGVTREQCVKRSGLSLEVSNPLVTLFLMNSYLQTGIRIHVLVFEIVTCKITANFVRGSVSLCSCNVKSNVRFPCHARHFD